MNLPVTWGTNDSTISCIMVIPNGGPEDVLFLCENPPSEIACPKMTGYVPTYTGTAKMITIQ